MQHGTYSHLRNFGLGLLALTLAACGGDGNGGGGDDTPEPSAAQFDSEAKTWSLALPGAGDALCYDIDLAEETVCDGSDWDLKLASGGRTVTLWTNGGVSGDGQGAAFGLLDWTELLGWINATTDPVSGQDVSAHYFADSAASVFSQDSWYAYDLEGTHKLYPNYRVYLISTDPSALVSDEYALQVIGYYGGTGGTTSGYPKIRWIDRSAPETVMELTIDATGSETWVYVDLAAGEVLTLDDAAAAESADWQIAFKRSEIKLNGGTSGPGSVAGFLGKTPEGFYDDAGEPVVGTFLETTPEETLAELTAEDIAEPANASAWVSDSYNSVLNPPYTGSYPQPLDYGWYTYYPTGDAANGVPPHGLKANPENGALLRSAAGDSYARFHLTDIAYSGAASTWTFEFHVQPAAE